MNYDNLAHGAASYGLSGKSVRISLCCLAGKRRYNNDDNIWVKLKKFLCI